MVLFIQPEDIKDAFSYELTIRPTSLFDKDGLMNKADKPELRKALANLPGISGCVSPEIPKQVHYVVDDGSLLQRIPWVVGDSYAEICNSYIYYLISHYGCKEKITVVFDGGYLEASTKDTTHLRRLKGKVGRKIVPSLTNALAVKKDTFLLCKHNKQLFLLMLGQQLTNAGIEVQHASNDALEKSQQKGPVTVVGEDTDLLMLLLYHYQIGIHSSVYLYSNASKTAWNIEQAKHLIVVELSQSILAIPALCGCDTTSHIQSVGPKSVIKTNFSKTKNCEVY